MYADDDDRRRNNASKHAFKTEKNNLRTKFDNSGPNLKDPTKL